MQNFSTLSDLRSDYIRGKLDRKMLEGLIFQYLLDNFDRYRLFRGNREGWSDFISWLYPRLSRAVDYYKDTGTTFDTYINSIIQWSSKEYRVREAEHRTTEIACWKARAEERELRSPEPPYMEEEPAPENGAVKKNYSQRQILVLFLKSYYFVSEDFLQRVAAATGMQKDRLQAMVDELHKIREAKEERIHNRQERIYSQYYRCLAFQKRLSTAMPGSARYEKLTEYTDRAKKRFSAMKQRFGSIRTEATNRQIASVMHIPKGTVDSVLHAVREKTESTYGNTVRIPVEEKGHGLYHEPCSVTATVSMQAVPQTLLST